MLMVEGYTEKHREAVGAFLKRWLDARLEQPVGIATVRFDGWQALVANAPKRAHFYLEQARDHAETIAVIGLIDLYGPTFYPKDVTSVKERYAWGKVYLEGQVAHPRFRQFFAVHETEAWLLSDLQRFTPEIRKALAEKVKNPETVNFDEPPAKLLDRVYMSLRKRHYDKVSEAKNHFPYLDPEVAAQKCPYLQQMLDELLALVLEARREN